MYQIVVGQMQYQAKNSHLLLQATLVHDYNLTAAQAEVYVMQLKGHTHDEIAEARNTTKHCIRQLLYYARRQLKAHPLPMCSYCQNMHECKSYGEDNHNAVTCENYISLWKL